jgi:hypothetical protein
MIAVCLSFSFVYSIHMPYEEIQYVQLPPQPYIAIYARENIVSKCDKSFIFVSKWDLTVFYSFLFFSKKNQKQFEISVCKTKKKSIKITSEILSRSIFKFHLSMTLPKPNKKIKAKFYCFPICNVVKCFVVSHNLNRLCFIFSFSIGVWKERKFASLSSFFSFLIQTE